MADDQPEWGAATEVPRNSGHPLMLALLLHRALLGGRDQGLLGWWAVGAASMIALDAAEVWVLPEEELWVQIGTLAGFAVSLTIVFAATIGASPSRMLTHKGRHTDPDAWRRFLPGLPLLIGTVAAWMGAPIWAGLDASAIRTLAEAMEVASRQGLTGQLKDLCVGAVRPEYFAQVSQVIPLLIVALGLEIRFYERLLKEPVQRALTIFTVLILCIGEAWAISALPSPNQGCGNVLSAEHENGAFLFTLWACFIALATLVWALVAIPPTDRGKPSADPQDEG